MDVIPPVCFWSGAFFVLRIPYSGDQRTLFPITIIARGVFFQLHFLRGIHFLREKRGKTQRGQICCTSFDAGRYGKRSPRRPPCRTGRAEARKKRRKSELQRA